MGSGVESPDPVSHAKSWEGQGCGRSCWLWCGVGAGLVCARPDLDDG